MTPDLKSYDFIVINTSAGKDSQAMMEYVMGLAKEAGITDRVIAVHCDLGRVEWGAVLTHKHDCRSGWRFDGVTVPAATIERQHCRAMEEVGARHRSLLIVSAAWVMRLSGAP